MENSSDKIQSITVMIYTLVPVKPMAPWNEKKAITSQYKLTLRYCKFEYQATI